MLLAADVGVAATTQIVERLRTQVDGAGDRVGRRPARAAGRRADRRPRPRPRPHRWAPTGTTAGPGVVLVVGVNGAGKTTTVGKIARVLVGDGKSVVLGAADTFRAAAADQLETWGERVGVLTVRGREGGDPASVAFEAVRTGVGGRGRHRRRRHRRPAAHQVGPDGRARQDQAGRREAGTGHRGAARARRDDRPERRRAGPGVHRGAWTVTGVVLTKLDGTAKGGIVVSVQRELGIPVKLIGLGEGADDLAPFEPRAFAEGLVGEALEPSAPAPSAARCGRTARPPRPRPR